MRLGNATWTGVLAVAGLAGCASDPAASSREESGPPVVLESHQLAATYSCGSGSGASCTVTFSGTTDTRDTTIAEDSAPVNHDYDGATADVPLDFSGMNGGAEGSLYIGAAGASGGSVRHRALLRFTDYGSKLPTSNATIDSATLSLSVNRSPGVAGTMQLRRLGTSFVEGSDTFLHDRLPTAVCTDGATWDSTDCTGGTSWTGGGSTTWRESQSVGTSASTITFNSSNLSNDVQNYVDGDLTNNGWLLEYDSTGESTSNTVTKVDSSEGSTPPSLAVVYTCSTDYEPSGSGTTCEQIDDCADSGGDTSCVTGQSGNSCSDGSETWSCTCGNAAYVVSGTSCVDYDECANNGGNTSCVIGQSGNSCSDATAPSTGFSCTCGNAAYVVSGSSCVDYDECANNGGNTSCVTGQSGNSCSDATAPSTGYSCTCGNAAYVLSGSSCADYDECTNNGGNTACVTGQSGNSCTDATAPSTGYSCTCGNAAYVASGNNCVDFDECADNGGDTACVTGQTGNSCNDATAPSTGYSCTCNNAAYVADGSSCADYDECADNGGNTACVTGQSGNSCTDATAPSTGFSCTCGNAAYVADGNSCSDFDECADNGGNTACVTGQSGNSCTDAAAPSTGWSCTCDNAAYVASGNDCVDFDECADNGGDTACAAAQTGNSCADASAPSTGWDCTCSHAAYVLSGDGNSCDDYDECADNGGNTACETGQSGNTCNDAAAPSTGWSCSCGNAAYVASGDDCVDFDECADNGGNTACETGQAGNSCSDAVAPSTGWGCTCANAGYVLSGDGLSCDDYDECADNGGNTSCVTGQAGNSCADASAPSTGWGCTCSHAGYVVSGDGLSCEDYDECADNGGDAACVTGQTGNSCTDAAAPGTGFTCTCGNAAYELSGSACVDRDECDAAAEAACASGEAGNSCNDTVAPGTGYSCTCGNAGYELSGDGLSCVDVDGCSGNLCDANGDTGSSCNDVAAPGTGYTCTCGAGFESDGNASPSCVDIDECDDDPARCDFGTCTDIDNGGGYTCTCNSGYDIDPASTPYATVCVLENECTSGSNDCDANADCFDAAPPTNFTCSCQTGYTDTGTARTGECVDTAGCSPDPCDDSGDSSAVCSDVAAPGTGNTCACSSGYESTGTDPTICTNIDGCDAGALTACATGQGSNVCNDVAPPGTGHTCTCGNAAYVVDGDGDACVDFDECASNGGNGSCVTGQGGNLCTDASAPSTGWTCTCGNAGYVVSGDGQSCVDVDGCDVAAQAACVIAQGNACNDVVAPGTGHTCSCSDPAYVANGANDACVDFDECADNGGNGACVAGEAGNVCADTAAPGTGWDCTCGNAGYVVSADGNSCEDFDECADNGGDAACITGEAGNTCGDLAAPGTGWACSCAHAAYVVSADASACEDFDECADNGGDVACVIGEAGNSCADTAAPGTGWACTCGNAGYVLSGDGESCVEFDECANNGGDAACVTGESGNSCADATAPATGWTCTCDHPGYELAPDGQSCVNVDECADNGGDGACVTSQADNVCTDAAAPATGWSCTCDNAAYTVSGDGAACEDADECDSAAEAACVSGESGNACGDIPAPGTGYACSCGHPAYDLAVDGRACEDIDGCDAGAQGACAITDAPNACSDVPAPGVGHTCTCDHPAYVLSADGMSCLNRDECADNGGDAACVIGDAGNACTDAAPPATGWACTCDHPAYEVSPDGQGCLDVDECDAAALTACVTGEAGNACGDQVAPLTGYLCTCAHPAYVATASADGCVDLDECEGGGETACVAAEAGNSCADGLAPATGYACTCGHVAYELSGDGLSCQDIDGCDAAAQAACVVGQAGNACNDVTAPGVGHTCSCDHPGYAVSDDGQSCVDLDACQNQLCDAAGDTDAACIDAVAPAAGYTCTCGFGFESDGNDPESCIDIDECSTGTDNCHPNASCANTVGGHDCTCSPGYSGSGVTCLDIDECAEGSDTCSDDAECRNNEGSFECLCGAGKSDGDDGCQVRCGDALLGDGEACDDGNETSGDGCRGTENPDDTENPPCAVEEGFACYEFDDGSVCLPTCGDGLVDADEECDDGDANSDSPDRCRTDCTSPRCGDRIVDGGEECDDGNEEADDGCTLCLIDLGFECDDADAGSVCMSTCGDGVVDDGEECDNGVGNSNSAPDACRGDCVAARCGDGVVDSAEQCDDGEALSDTESDACRTDCQAAFCGDGVVDTGEECDTGADRSDSAADACRTDCRAARCGDGVIDGDEQCDLGDEYPDPLPDGACTSVCDALLDAGVIEPDGGLARTPDGSVAVPPDAPKPKGTGLMDCSTAGSRGGAWWAALMALCLFRRRRSC